MRNSWNDARSLRWIVGAVIGTLLAVLPARADVDPWLGYAYGSVGTPWQLSVRQGDWSTNKSDRSLGDGSQLGLGIGYSGWNAQLDFVNPTELSRGILTVGRRERLQFGKVELWGRLAAGPAVVIENKDLKRDTSLGFFTTAETGIDYVFFDMLAVGVRGQGVPGWDFGDKGGFSCDFGLGLNVRLAL